MSKNSAILLISGPDKRGIVASVTGFLYQHNGNIIHSDHHEDAELGVFLSRIEWDLDGFQIPMADFDSAFSPVAKQFGMTYKVALSQERPRMAILVSKYDHCLSDLLYRHQAGELHCEIPLIISNHPDTRHWSEFYRIPFFQVPVVAGVKEKAERETLRLLGEHRIDLVVLARYMQILSADFVKAYENRIINIHHSFLPAFLGAKPYHRAYERGVKLIGATSHYVTEELDDGPIIEQDVIRISHRDSVSELVQKGKDLERIVLSRAVKWHLENRVLTYGNRTVVFD